MKIAIVGSSFGVSGHLPAFSSLPGVEVLAVADSGSGRINDRLPAGVAYLPSWRDALTMSIDAISVAVPPASQRDIVIEALRLKKHVFCEKPFGMNTTEARAMLTASAEAADCATAVNFQFRFEPGIQVLRSQIESGAIGNLHSIDFSWLTAGRADPQLCWTWKNDQAVGGGVIGAFFSHAADLVWWLTRKEVRAVFGQTAIVVKHLPDKSARMREVTAEDMVTAQLQLEDGVIATCRISNCQMGGDGMRIEARGSSGVLDYRHVPPYAPEDRQVRISVAERRDVLVPIPSTDQVLDAADSRLWAVRMAASQFVRKAQGDTNACAPDFADGVRVHKIMHGLRQSALNGHNIAL